MIKTVTLTGSEVKVTDLGGQNAAVKNLGSGSIYVSTKPNITAGADNVIEIPAGAGEVVLDTNGTVYIVGTGKVQCTGTPYATPNFKLPSSSSGGGGGTSDVTKEYVDAQDTTNLNLAKAYTDNAKSEIQTTIDTLDNTLNTHIADRVKHITAEERAKWNAKAETDTATTTADGLMSAADKEKLDGVAANANNYSLPLATASVRGGVKIGYEENGKNYPVELANEKMFVNVPWENTTYTNFVKSGSGAKSGLVPAPSTTAGTTKYLREDGTWTVPPNTTYSAATTSTAGLMSSSDKSKLDGIAVGANNYVHPTNAGNKHIPSGGSKFSALKWSADGTAIWGTYSNLTVLSITSLHGFENGQEITATRGLDRSKCLFIVYHRLSGATDYSQITHFYYTDLDKTTGTDYSYIFNTSSSRFKYKIDGSGNLVFLAESGENSDVNVFALWFN